MSSENINKKIESENIWVDLYVGGGVTISIGDEMEIYGDAIIKGDIYKNGDLIGVINNWENIKGYVHDGSGLNKIIKLKDL